MFGGSSFGNSGFGSGGGFGQQNQNSTFGQTNNSFGAGFGQQNQQTGFNNNTSGTPGFGSTPAFGQQPTQAAQSGFGGASSGSGLFGATPNTSTAFGGFGANNSATNNTATTGFGSTGSTGLFGQTPAFGSSNTTTGGAFGSNSFNSNASGTGTASPAYSVTQDKDTSTGVISLLQSISAMPAYRNYSFEELRAQDYEQGRKSAGQPGAAGFGQPNSFASNTTGFGGSTTGFGATPTSNAGGLFGSGNTQQATGFGQAAGFGSGGFGSNANTTNTNTSTGGLFGSSSFGNTNPTNTLFGQNTSNPSGGFGANSSSTSPFGQATTTPAFGTGGGFGNTTPSKPTFGFGSGASTTTSTPFGAAATPAFGSAPTATTGGFGFGSNNATNTGTGFGAGATNTGFGSGGFGAATSTAPAAPSFGFGGNTGSSFGATPATSSSFSFGNTNNALGANNAAKPAFGFGNPTATSAPGGGLFGNSTTTSTAGSSLFGGNTSTTTPSLFGNTGATTNTFGSSLNTAGTGLGGLLNKPAGTTGGLFGTSTNTGFGSGFGLSNSSGLGASMQNTGGLGSINQTPMHASIDKNPYGNNPLFSTLPSASTNATSPLHSGITNTDVLASSVVQKKKYSNVPHFKSTPRSSSKIKLRGFPLGSSMGASTYKLSSSSSAHLFESTNDDTVLSPEAFTPKQSVKKLVINHKIGDALEKGTPIFGGSTPNSQSATPSTNPRTVKFNPDLNTYFGHDDSESPLENQENGVRTLSYLMADTSNDSLMNPSPVNNDFGTEYGFMTSPTKLPTSEYWCSPSVGELRKLSKEGLKNISEFEVGRVGYGKVRFLEPVDISNLDISLILGEIVIFERKSCTVYPDETIKPQVGNGLNVPALISLEQCWPIDKSTRKFITDRNSPRLQQHIRKMKSIPETEFVDFNLDDGSWSFIVQHFSRYGLDDDDEEEETLPVSNTLNSSLTPEIIAEESVRVINKRLLNDEDMVDAPPVSWLSPESDDSEREELYNSIDESGIEDTFASPSRGVFMEEEESDYADVGMIGSHWGVSSNADLFKSSSSALNESQQSKPWAKQLGLEAHKVHVMQASLFRDSIQDTNPPLLKPVSTIATSWSSKPDHEPTNVRFGQDMEIQDESDYLPESGREVRASHFSSARSIRPAKKHARITYEKSLSHSKSDCLVDAGLMMGRSFRVGWGPGGIMVSSGRIVTLQNLVNPSTSTEPLSQVNVQRVQIFQNEDVEKQKHEITLKTQLDHTEITLDDNGVPMASTSSQLDFKSFVEKLDSNPRKSFETHEVLVWKLAQALWDNTFVPPNDMLSGQALERLSSIHNKTSFTNWLQEAVRPEMLAHIQQLEAKGNNAGIIFAYITGNRISKACVECIKNRDFRLSTLISQAGGDAQSRIDIAHQVLKWKEYRFQSNINADYTRLYELLSGNICPQSIDSLDRQDKSVYVHEGLDWKRTLGLFMWYASFLETSMAESVAKYEHAFLEQNCSVPVALPVPWYQKDSSIQSSQYDILYCLIKVYIDPTYSLEDAILPLSISPSPLDHRLSWHLFIMLERVLGVRLFERYEDSIDSSPGANACISFAFQLERLGLWKWAVFIILHLKDTGSREVAIRELIFRHISVEPIEQESDSLPEIQFNEDEMFLLNTLKVPSDWIYEAKALHAKSNGMNYEEAVCLLQANKWNLAHQLIVEKLAPDALLRNQIYRLKSLLSHIDSEEVADWENGGFVFLEYIEIFENLPKIFENSHTENVSDYIALKNQMTQLLRTLSRMKEKCFTNTQQTVCIAEMASKISRSLSEIDLAEHKEQHLLKNLPLPEDQRLHAVLKLSYIQLYSN